MPSGRRRLKPAPVVQLFCLACVAFAAQLGQLCFVLGAQLGGDGRGHFLTLRRRQSPKRTTLNKEAAGRRSNISNSRKKAKKHKKLRSRMKKARSDELIVILDEALDDPSFDFLHASVAYGSLARAKKERGLQPSDWDSPVIARLHARVLEMMMQDQFDNRAAANILWSIATVSDRFSIPTQLLVPLVKSLPAKAKCMEAVSDIATDIFLKAEGMKPQELSNCLWASAHLKEVAPAVLVAVPAIVNQIADKAKDMDPQALSDCLWASVRLREVAPGVLRMVPAIAAQIPEKARDMIPQQLSKCLWACGQLEGFSPKVLEIVLALAGDVSLKVKDMKPREMSNTLEVLARLQALVPEISRLIADSDGDEDILRSAVARFNTLLPSLRGKDLNINIPITVWACAKLGVYPREFLTSVAQYLSSREKLSVLHPFCLCALAWSYQALGAENFHLEFRDLLKSEAQKRGFTQADVESTRLGYLKWNHAQLTIENIETGSSED